MHELEGNKVVSESTLYILIWAEFAICTVVIALRTYSQVLVVRKPFLDDIVMIGAYILQAVASGLCTAATHWGLGTNLAILMLDRGRVRNMMQFATISMPFGVFGPMLGRISFIIFLQTTVLTGTVHRLRRTLLWGLIVLHIVTNVIPIILQYTQCKPISALWDPYQVLAACQDLLPVQRYGFFQGALNALTDIILVATGLLVIIHLKLRRKTKIILCGILSLSSLAIVAAILRTIQLRLMTSSSVSYAYAMWSIWFLTEGTVIIVTASIPRLRPIMVVRKKPTRVMYNRTFGDEASTQYGGLTGGTRLMGSVYVERSNDGTLAYPMPVVMRWNNDSGSDRQDLIALEEEISASHSMQKFIYS